jgi:hypothetical protein
MYGLKMVELLVKDKDGRIVNRVAVNEKEFNRYIKKMNRKDNMDYSTRWFIRFIYNIFLPVSSGSSNIITWTDITGTSRTTLIKSNISASILWTTSSCNFRMWISVGTSSTAPTRDDFKLGNKIAEGISSISVDETNGIITLSASFSFTSDTTIYEVGLDLEAAVGGQTTCGRVLFDRTVISNGIIVPAGQTLSVVYKFTL